MKIRKEFYVSAFVSRPVIYVRSKDGGSRLGVFNFSDVLVSFSTNLTVTELEEAYRRAGSAFKGQLQQNFVVLTEQSSGKSQREGLNSEALVSKMGSPSKHRRENWVSGPQTHKAENKPNIAKKA